MSTSRNTAVAGTVAVRDRYRPAPSPAYAAARSARIARLRPSRLAR